MRTILLVIWDLLTKSRKPRQKAEGSIVNQKNDMSGEWHAIRVQRLSWCGAYKLIHSFGVLHGTGY